MLNILDAAIVSDSELIDYYKNNIHYFTLPEEINLQEIIVDRKDLSDSLLELIKSGKDFGELARNFSLRDWSAKNNGEIGFSPIDKFGNLKETFSNSNVGELIGPVRIENYYGLFKILGKKDPRPIEFSIIKKSVRDAFIFEQRTKLRDEYINKIRNGLEIKIDYKLLASFNILG
ncbi:MAG: peptidylprolyl isomerase [Ignavibacteriales bacterium]|nr:peptidylprolyl isomerase [Ignavibacteriales bacterium]